MSMLCTLPNDAHTRPGFQAGANTSQSLQRLPTACSAARQLTAWHAWGWIRQGRVQLCRLRQTHANHSHRSAPRGGAAGGARLVLPREPDGHAGPGVPVAAAAWSVHAPPRHIRHLAHRHVPAPGPPKSLRCCGSCACARSDPEAGWPVSAAAPALVCRCTSRCLFALHSIQQKPAARSKRELPFAPGARPHPTSRLSCTSSARAPFALDQMIRAVTVSPSWKKGSVQRSFAPSGRVRRRRPSFFQPSSLVGAPSRSFASCFRAL